MKINKILATTVSIATLCTLGLFAVPVFAQTQGSAIGNNAPTSHAGRFRSGTMGSSTWRMSSSTRPMMGSSTRGFRGGMMGSSTLQQRIANMNDRGGHMLDQRTASLQKMLSRIGSMKNLSDSQKAALTSEIQSEITNLNNLKTKISTDTSTTTLKTDIQSITKSERIYALVEPQTNVTAAADRVNTLITMLNTVSTKIQTRLAADTTASANATVQSSLADLSAKLADANTQATAATTEVAGLQPDNGNQTIFQSNEAALKDAHSKIQTAQKDIVAARKDIDAIIKVLVGDIRSLNDTGTTTTN